MSQLFNNGTNEAAVLGEYVGNSEIIEQVPADGLIVTHNVQLIINMLNNNANYEVNSTRNLVECNLLINLVVVSTQIVPNEVLFGRINYSLIWNTVLFVIYALAVLLAYISRAQTDEKIQEMSLSIEFQIFKY